MLPASPFLYKKDLDSASINKPHQATNTPSSSFFLSVPQTQHNQRTDTHKGTNIQTRLETEMESSDTYTPTSSAPLSHSPTSSSSSPPPPPPPTVVMSPCAACKILRRRCAEKCVLAPYFPPTEPAKFTIAHRVFGASNIIKFLQELPESQRADAVTSMVYEASARIRDPVYGCAGAICQLQKQVNELQAQLAKSQAELVTMQLQQANLVALICMEMAQSPQESPQQSVDNFISTPPHTGGYQSGINNFFEENTSPNALWEPLWT